MSFITCGGRLLNLAYAKAIYTQGPNIHVIMANSHQSSHTIAYNMDMIWKCPRSEFKIVDMKEVPSLLLRTDNENELHNVEPVKYQGFSAYPPN